MTKLKSIYLFILTALGLLLAGIGCTPAAEPSSGVSALGTPVAAASVSITPAADGALQLSTESVADKIVTGVANAEVAVTLDQGVKAATTAPVSVGTLSARRVSFQVNAVSTCVKDFGVPGDAICTNPEPAAKAQEAPGGNVELPKAASAPTVTDLQQEIILHAGIVCGGWYAKTVWQKAFDVRLAGSAAHLDQVDHVDYDVFAAYADDGKYRSTDRAAAFALGKRFLTPVTGWQIGAAKAQLKDGTTLSLAGATINWSLDEDPTRKPGEDCQTSGSP